MNIVFLGSGAFGLPSLEALARSNHRILHVLSQPDRPAGRGKHLTPTPVAQWALDRHLPLTRAENANAPDVLATLRALNPDCFVVIAFGQKLSDELLAIPTRGKNINLHSSLLPRYRGAAPINWAVINNDPQAGVCVIEVTSVMDAGDIFAAAATPVGESETAGELHDRLAQLGAPLLPQVLDQISAGALRGEKQNPAQATRAPKLRREMAWVDFTQAAPLVSARIRGMSPWPGIQVELDPGGAKTLATILKCRAVDAAPHPLDYCGTLLADKTIACAVGSIEILTLQPAGKKSMDLQSFINGYGFKPGMRIRSVVPPPASQIPR